MSPPAARTPAKMAQEGAGRLRTRRSLTETPNSVVKICHRSYKLHPWADVNTWVIQQQRRTVDRFELFQTGGKQRQRSRATIVCNAPIWPEDGGINDEFTRNSNLTAFKMTFKVPSGSALPPPNNTDTKFCE